MNKCQREYITCEDCRALFKGMVPPCEVEVEFIKYDDKYIAEHGRINVVVDKRSVTVK